MKAESKEYRKTEEEEEEEGDEMVGGSVSLRTMRTAFCFVCVFHRPQRETGREGVIVYKKERWRRRSTSWWAIMTQFSMFR